MANITKIRTKRTQKSSYLDSTNTDSLNFGEPLLYSNGDTKYLIIGNYVSTAEDIANSSTYIQDSIFFRGLDKDTADRQVTYDKDTKIIQGLDGTGLYVNKVKSESIIEIPNKNTTITAPYYILCKDANGNLVTFDLVDDAGIYIDNNSVLHGAAWNDYAEGREFVGTVDINELPGYVVCENGKGQVELSNSRLQPCSYVVSDTFGMTIGEGNINVAVVGKVKVLIDDDVEVGDCVAAGENGKAVKMTRPEIINYPDRILGTVIEPNTDGKTTIKVR